MRVIKKNGDIEIYNDEKIKRSVIMAFHSVNVTLPNIDSIVEEINREVTKIPGDEITTEVLGNIIESILMHSGFGSVAKAYILYRKREKVIPPRSELIQDYIVAAKYALPGEVYKDIIDRVMQMHRRRYAGDGVTQYLDDIYVALLDKRIVPSMRSMQFAGPAIEAENARLYNCAYTLVNRLRAFSETFYLLLCGCGVGFSVQWHHIEKLPKIQNQKADADDYVFHYTVPDTIQGWAKALDMLVTGTYEGYWIEFDYSKIRKKGSVLKTSGGLAPGHLPLREMLEKVRLALLRGQGRKLRPIEVHDIICLSAEAVLSGGIRRSSLISIFSPHDTEMMYAKAKGNFVPGGLNSQRQMANNSVMVLRNSVDADKILDQVIELSKENYGEPGFYLSESTEYGPNPCGEIGLDPRNGFQFCNLTEIDVSKCKDKADFATACRAAAALGTFQAGYTDFEYLTKETKENCERDALLGVSLTGIFDNLDCLDWLEEGAEVVRKVNKEVAAIIGINKAARMTTVKPSGTASLVLGCASGIHPHHAPRYFRRVTARPNEPAYLFFRKHNPHMCSIKPNGDAVITFTIETKGRTLPIDAIEHLEIIKRVYNTWITGGSNSKFRHNISATIVVNDISTVQDWIKENKDSIGALSFVSESLDKLYPYAPREAVTTEQDEILWNYINKLAKNVDWRLYNSGRTSIDQACDGGACIL